MNNIAYHLNCNENTLVEYFGTNRKQMPFLVKTEKQGVLTYAPLSELHKFQFIAINQRKLNIVHIEVDDTTVSDGCIIEPAFDQNTYEEHGIPLPNFAVISSGHKFHCFWLLKNPLPKQATFESLSFFHDVRRKMLHVLGGDPACNISGAVRNPFYKGTDARSFSDNARKLSELNLPIRLDARIYTEFFTTFQEGSRNNAAFQAGLNYFKRTPGISFEHLFQWLETLQSLYPNVKPLPYTELRSIAVSIFNHGGRYKTRDTRNYGRMNLPKEDYSDKDCGERVAIIRGRQAAGAQFTNKMQREKTLTRMACAWEELLREGRKPTQKLVSERADVCLRTVKTYWRDEAFRARITSPL